MGLSDTFLVGIDTRSFSNIWYWIVMTTVWSSLSYWVLGIPYRVVYHAMKGHQEARLELDNLMRLKALRYTSKSELNRSIRLLVSFFLLTTFTLLAVIHRIEIAQALLLLYAPILCVSWLSQHVLKRLIANDFDIDQSCRTLKRLRLITQIIGMIAVFISALWGMYHNISNM